MSDLPIPVSTLSGGINRDYATIFTDLKNLIPHFTPEWTYTGEDDLGITLLQLLSYLADHIHYRGDTVIRDLRASTTVDRHVLVQLSEWLAYFPKRATPARAEVTFSIAAPLAIDYYIPAGTPVSAPASNLPENDSSQISFELEGQLELRAGELSVTGTVVQGETINVTLGSAIGEAFESFVISDTDAIFNQGVNDLLVRVNGAKATFVKYAAMTTPADLSYTVRELQTGELEIRFGDGNYGKRLSQGDVVTCAYRSGGGLQGLVAAGAINNLDTILTYSGNPLTVSVTNAERSYGGNPEETPDKIRRNAPASFRTQNRAVTLEDYTFHAMGVEGVFKARPVRIGVNGLLFYIVPDNAFSGFEITEQFRSRFFAVMDSVRMATDVVEMQAAELVPIDAILHCYAFPSQRNVNVRRRVIEEFTTIGGILDPSTNVLGQHLRRSDMVGRVEAVEGLDYLNVVKYSRRPSLRWVINSGGAVLDTALPEDIPTVTDRAVDEVWTITFTTDTSFTVVGSVTGDQIGQNQSGPGALDQTYHCKNVSGETMVTFKLKSGATPMQPGDRANLTVGTLDRNIQLRPGEFPVGGELSILVYGGID